MTTTPHDFEPKPDIRPGLIFTPCAICDNPQSAAIHQPPRYMVPQLQIHISEEGLEAAAEVLAKDPYITEPEKIAGLAVAAALSDPPTVTNQTVETLVRALLMTYPDHRWDGIKLRQMVEGLLLSLGVEVEG